MCTGSNAHMKIGMHAKMDGSNNFLFVTPILVFPIMPQLNTKDPFQDGSQLKKQRHNYVLIVIKIVNSCTYFS